MFLIEKLIERKVDNTFMFIIIHQKIIFLYIFNLCLTNVYFI